MKKTIIIGMLFCALFLVPSSLSAETETDLNLSPTMGQIRKDIEATITKKREEIRENVQKEIELMKQKQETIKTEMLQFRELKKKEYEASREAFKKNLESIRDQQKKDIVLNLDRMIQDINAKQTNHFSDVLNRLSSTLDSLDALVAKAKAAGADTASASATVAAARDAINSAKQAVASQAAEEYVFTFRDKNTLKPNVGDTQQKLRSDLKSVFDKVMLAKEAVRKAAKAVHELRKKGFISSVPLPSLTSALTPTAAATVSASPTP